MYCFMTHAYSMLNPEYNIKKCQQSWHVAPMGRPPPSASRGLVWGRRASASREHCAGMGSAAMAGGVTRPRTAPRRQSRRRSRQQGLHTSLVPSKCHMHRLVYKYGGAHFAFYENFAHVICNFPFISWGNST